MTTQWKLWKINEINVKNLKFFERKTSKRKKEKSFKMPKIFLIKNRLHQQQLRLLESQNLIQAKNENRLNIGDSQSYHDDREPLSLVAKNRNTSDNSASSWQNEELQKKKNDAG